ncbi:thioredoxin-like [Musca vetustissima]|uniref:thioredoxin-like n=1 Tax=Musca vetustissima TaxID=27455 RepID=UPI002AB7D70C|nr:thioredoxin-like [Musca vetustissima]
MASSSNSKVVCHRLLPSIATVLQKCISQNHGAYKTYSIKNQTEFNQKVMQSDHPVVVDFHANWCDPCTKLTPRICALLDNSEDIDLAIIDVEKNTELVDTFNIQSVPTVFTVRNGEIVHKFIGLVEANILKSMVDTLKTKNTLNIKGEEVPEDT